jgi:hypothetical protein
MLGEFMSRPYPKTFLGSREKNRSRMFFLVVFAAKPPGGFSGNRVSGTYSGPSQTTKAPEGASSNR